MKLEKDFLKRIYETAGHKPMSCGFLIIDSTTGKMVAAHPTGEKDGLHDILKGHQEAGETPIQTAIREVKEESGIDIDLNNTSIEDYGRFKYNKLKDLYVFKITMPVDVKALHCDSMFTGQDGVERPEMDGFELTDNVNDFFLSLRPIIRKVIG